MATRQDFCNEMNRMYENHGVYVGTGNGERTLDVAGKFFEMEKNSSDDTITDEQWVTPESWAIVFT